MFQGADVDGLDQVATISTAGADATDAVKAACEAIADALVFAGPAGAQFASFLKTVVIPWMNVVAQCLRAFSAVLKAASTVQRAVSAGETVDTSGQPKYQSPEQLPAGDTRNYPVVTEDGGSSSAGSAGDGSSTSGASTADGCGKDDSGATTVPAADGGGKDDSGATAATAADSCDKDAVKTETVATGSEKDTVKPENLTKDGGGDSSGKDGGGDSSGKDGGGSSGGSSGPKPPASGGGDPELEFLGQPVIDEHDAARSVQNPLGANVMSVSFFDSGVDGPGGLDVKTGLALGLAGAGAAGLAKLAYGKRNQAGATTVDAADEPPANSRTSGDAFAGGGHNGGGTGYGAPTGIDAFAGADPKATTQGSVTDKLVSAGVEGRGQLSGAATSGLKVGGYAGLAHGLGGPGRGFGDVDVDGLASRGSDQADQVPRPVGNGHGDQPERQSGHGAATVAPVWPNRNR